MTDVPFGSCFIYREKDRSIVDFRNKEDTTYTFDDYMSKTKCNNVWQFTDSKLALSMFECDLNCSTLSVLEELITKKTLLEGQMGSNWYWLSVQLSLPLIDLIGKLLTPRPKSATRASKKGRFKKIFIDGVTETFRNADAFKNLSDSKQKIILDVLWYGVRCGVLHTGFLEASHNYDVLVTGETQGEPICLISEGVEQVVKINAEPFVRSVVEKLRERLCVFRTDKSLREKAFLPLWQARWGCPPV